MAIDGMKRGSKTTLTGAFYVGEKAPDYDNRVKRHLEDSGIRYFVATAAHQSDRPRL